MACGHAPYPYESSPIFLNPFNDGDERTNGERIGRGGDETGELGAVIIPEPTECPTKSIERCQSILTPLSSTMTIETQQCLHEVMMKRIKQGEQKGIDKQNHAKEFETSLQRPQAWTFQRQLAFGIPKTGFDLPTPPIREKDPPCLRFGCDWFVGHQVHDVLLDACFDEIQGLVCDLGMIHHAPPEISRHLLASMTISDLFVRQVFFPVANLPEVLFHPGRREKDMPFDPADDKPCSILSQHRQPGTRCIAAIKDVDQQRSPLPHGDAQEVFFCLPLPAGKGSSSGPPMGERQVGTSMQAHDERGSPLHAHHTYRAQRWPVKHQIPFGAASSFGFARKDWTQPLQSLALCFFDHTAIPEAADLFFLSGELLDFFIRFLQQKALDLFPRPFEGSQEISHPFGACGSTRGLLIAAQIRS